MKALLPYLSDVDLTDIDIDVDVVEMRVQARPHSSAACPACGTPSIRVHSRYRRRVADLPIGGRPVHLLVRIRRLYCHEPACTKTAFAEQVPGVSQVHQERIPGLRRLLQTVARHAAGRDGARLAAAAAVTTSRSTMLRLLLRTRPPEAPTPRVCTNLNRLLTRLAA